jgi:hypothetical protein
VLSIVDVVAGCERGASSTSSFTGTHELEDEEAADRKAKRRR